MRRELPSGTVTFLFTDIEGSTRLLHELGAVSYAEALAEHRRVLREAFERHGGVEVDTQGDAFFYAFARATDALQAADAGRRALAGGTIRVRVGVHTGEPAVTEEGYVGADVHLAARVMAAGHGGQVVVSEATARLVEGVALSDLGEHRLKDLSAPRRLFQLGAGEFPPLRSLNATNLPLAAGPLVGRERELGEVQALFRDGARLVTLTGPGGSGKTRLALQAAAELVEHFPGGVFFVPLAGVTEPELVASTITTTIGVRDLAELAGRRALVVLDNYEHLLVAAPVASELLSCGPDARALATSRAPLRVEGEVEVEVAPLTSDDALELLTQRARAIWREFEPDDAARAVCARLDNLPLALELAASRLRSLDTAALLERLDRRLPLLTGGRRDAPARQRTLRATIEWSYDLLEPDVRAVFARLAVFAGTFSLTSAESVARATLDELDTLVETSLVKPVRGDRFLLLETIREYGLERLSESSDHAAVAAAHFAEMLALAESEEYEGEGPSKAWLGCIDADLDNVRAALRWALDAGDAAGVLRLACALGRFWVIRADREGYAWLSEALDAASSAPTSLRALGEMWAGSTIFFSHDYRHAAAHLEAALELFRELGDTLGVARALDRVSASYQRLGELDRARAAADESLALFRRLGDGRGVIYPLSKVAADEWERGDRERGHALAEEALALARGHDSWWAANQLEQLADMEWQRGKLDRAVAHARECVALAHQLASATQLAYGLALVARLTADSGDPVRAGHLLGAVDALEQREGTKLDAQTRARLDRLVADDHAMQRARAAGRTLDLDHAVELALRR